MTTQTKILSTVAGLIVIGVGYWLISPLFIDKFVNESLWKDGDTTNMNEQIADPSLMEEFKDTVEGSAQDQEMIESMPESTEPATLASGVFVDVAHEGTGDAKIIDLGDKKIVRLENLDVLNGPDLRVILSQSTYVRGKADLGYHIDLGSLKGNKGNQNYEIPADVDVSLFNTVIIYCNPFSVVFNTAKLDRVE